MHEEKVLSRKNKLMQKSLVWNRSLFTSRKCDRFVEMKLMVFWSINKGGHRIASFTERFWAKGEGDKGKSIFVSSKGTLRCGGSFVSSG